MNLIKKCQEIILTGKCLCRSLFFKKVASWNPVCSILKRDSGTGTYFPMNLFTTFLRKYIAENFQKIFMQKAAS